MQHTHGPGREQGGSAGIEPAPFGSQPFVQKPLHHEPRQSSGRSGSRTRKAITLARLPTEYRRQSVCPSRVPQPGIEPGTARSKRAMISVSPSRQEWTAGESNPDCRLATPVSSHWTSSPMNAVETKGIEPFQVACKASSPPWHMRPRLSVIPDGIEPSSPLCKRGIVGHWTTGPRDRELPGR